MTVPFVSTYEGAACPRCHVALAEFELAERRANPGPMNCMICGGEFEATAFTPPQRKLHVIEVAAAGPEGANACANHARNAAVTSCQRCGLFICALCEMNVGTGSLCPGCFERLSKDDAQNVVAKKYSDYRSLARISVTLGLVFSFCGLGAAGGVPALYFAFKARRQPHADRRPVFDAVIIIFAFLETLTSAGMLGLMIWSMFQVSKATP